MANKTQTRILKYLKTLPHCWAIKVIAANERGCPDIICCYRGRFVGIEVKKGRDRLSCIQTTQLANIMEAEGTTIVARCLDDVKDYLP